MTTSTVGRALLGRVAAACAVLAMLAVSAAGHGDEWTRVAAESASQAAAPSYFGEAQRWHYDVSAIPASILPAADPARDVAFDGAEVRVGFAGLAQAARYEVELTFLSDSDQRVQRVAAGSVVLEDRIALPFGQVVRRRWPIPRDAIQAGRLDVVVERLAGPNAVLAAVALYSTGPSAGAVHPAHQVAALPDAPWPRLSPRPASAAGTGRPLIGLSGTWQFHLSPPAGFWARGADTAGWKTIEVPGEWTMQGFTVARGTAAGYRREFDVPVSWRRLRVKLRFDGVYSDARVWVNGRPAGAHLGGFTPFELDVTPLVRFGRANMLAVSVRSDSLADTLASGCQYAAHDLGGIPRKVTLFAVPPVNVADVYVRTNLDRGYRDAVLTARVQVANETGRPVGGHAVRVTLGKGGPSASVLLGTIPPGKTITREVRLAVPRPRKWDPEHPNLYALTTALLAAGAPAETCVQRVGFRQVEVRGSQVFVNGRPVKLHGVCRHETHPLRGRALTGSMWRRDVQIFRDMNANYIRTSHYPPAEELVDACDELGMFLEVEAPFCWANGNRGPAALAYCAQAEMETVLRDRSHPSVLQWSMGNETAWLSNFRLVRRLLAQADGTRPVVWDGGGSADVDIDAPHYPGLGAPAGYAGASRPTLFGEYGHLGCYNRRELATDPGLRDAWGLGVAEMWERMRASRGVLGGSIWAGIDDLFYLPSGQAVGYGQWGPLDGWRRPRPEYWHLKEIYSPARVGPPVRQGATARLAVENRYLFTDLRECRFAWSIGTRHGVAQAAAPPGGTTALAVPVWKELAAGKTLEVRVTDPRGFTAGVYRFGPPPRPAVPVNAVGSYAFTEKPDGYAIEAAPARFQVNRTTGALTCELSEGTVALGPALMLLPLSGEGFSQLNGTESAPEPFNAACSDWRASQVEAKPDGKTVEVRVAGSYREAEGSYVFRFCGGGNLAIDYDFTLKQPVTPRQIGLVLSLPPSYDTLAWQRKAQWSAYPADHIGRPQGVARAFPGTPILGPTGPCTQPTWPWKDDCTPLGSNDFRSTKLNVLTAELIGKSYTLAVYSNGTQHVRAWMVPGGAHLLVADLANEGCPACFNEFALPRPSLRPGDHVTGTVRLQLLATE